MNPNDTPKGVAPAIPLSPEDDPKLQAIEALEARPEDLYPKPTPVEAILKPAPPVVVPTPPEPVVVAQSTPTPAQPVKPDVTPPEPVTPKTVAEKIDDEIANNPPSRKPFKFFINQQISKRSLIIIFSIIVLILIAIGAFVVLEPKF